MPQKNIVKNYNTEKTRENISKRGVQFKVAFKTKEMVKTYFDLDDLLREKDFLKSGNGLKPKN